MTRYYLGQDKQIYRETYEGEARQESGIPLTAIPFLLVSPPSQAVIVGDFWSADPAICNHDTPWDWDDLLDAISREVPLTEHHRAALDRMLTEDARTQVQVYKAL